MQPKREHIQKLITAISDGLYEREHVISLALLSAVAGESIFLLGLPGVAKSMIGRRLKSAFKDASSFEYLMSRFSTPDEIFGPVSISKLKNEDIYERIIDGYLPTADVVFLDEIWKAGPSIQNTLLTVLNEKIYRNGRTEIALPLKGIIAASNELPASNEGLEALWDRFLVRVIVDGIQHEKAFNAMISATSEMAITVDKSLQIGGKQYAEWQTQIDRIEIPPFVFDVISAIRKDINTLNVRGTEEVELAPIVISDRRWKKIIRLLRTSALLNERKEIEFSDLFLLSACLWDDEAQIVHVEKIVNRSILNHLLADWSDRKNRIDEKVKELEAVISKSNGNGFLLYEGKYYNITGLNDGNTFISKELYDSLSSRFAQEIVVTTKDLEGNRHLQTPPKKTMVPRELILKTDTGVKIGGTNFSIVRENDLNRVSDPDFREWIDMVIDRTAALHADFKNFMDDMKKRLNKNLFISGVCRRFAAKELAYFEMNLRKIINGLKNE